MATTHSIFGSTVSSSVSEHCISYPKGRRESDDTVLRLVPGRMHGLQSVTSAPPLFCLSCLSDKFRGLHAKKPTKQVSTSKDEARGIQQASQRVQRKKNDGKGNF